jgi:hypothetical protein
MMGTMSCELDDLLLGEGDDANVAAIEEAVAAVLRAMPGDGGRRLADRLRMLDRVRGIAEAATLEVVAEAARSGAFRDDGHVTVTNWVQAETNRPRGEAVDEARMAVLTAEEPSVLEQLRTGRVGVAQVREMARVRANPRVGPLTADVVARFLVEAQRLPFHVFRQLVRGWADLVDADGAHDDHEATHRNRRVHLSLVGNTWHLHGEFGAAQGAALAEILDRFARGEFDADWAAARAEHGDDASPSDLARTDRQRRADAVVEIFRRAAAANPAAKGPEPVVNVIVPSDVFEEQLAAMVEDRPPVFDTTSLRLRLCMTSDGCPLDPADAVAAALVGHVRRVVIGADGTIINFGRRQRLFSGAAREAALMQAVLDTGRRCLWPGCGRDHRIQIDHSDEWHHGGVTDLANAGPLCARHNRFKSSGYRTWRDPNGVWHTYRPDGTEIAPTAAA